MTANLKLVWSRHDAIDTAQAFNAGSTTQKRGCPNAVRTGRGSCSAAAVSAAPASTTAWRSASFMTFMALGVVVYAASAKADDTDDAAAVAYAAEYGPRSITGAGRPSLGRRAGKASCRHRRSGLTTPGRKLRR